jgi:tetratricopeptide (TPR) repeat protein
MNAYDFVMQAIELIYTMNFEDFARAGKLLRQAIAADDSYAAAYAYAALWQIHNIMQGWTNDQEEDRIEAERLAAAAVDRDPADGFALAILGHVKAVLFRDYDTAREFFDRALQAAPSNAMAWTLSSGVYSYMGDGRSAVERAERGLRLSPVDKQAFFYLSFLTMAHYINGTHDEAVIWGRKSVNLNIRHCASLRLLAVSLVALDRLDEARHVTQTLLQVQPRFRLSIFAQSCPYREEIAMKFIDRLRTAGMPD